MPIFRSISFLWHGRIKVGALPDRRLFVFLSRRRKPRIHRLPPEPTAGLRRNGGDPSGIDRLPKSGAGCDPGPFHSRLLRPPSGKDHYYSLDVGTRAPPESRKHDPEGFRGREHNPGKDYRPGASRPDSGFLRIPADRSRNPDHLSANPRLLGDTPPRLPFSAPARRSETSWLLRLQIFGQTIMLFICSNPFPPSIRFRASPIFFSKKSLPRQNCRGKPDQFGLGDQCGGDFFKTKWGARPFFPHESVLYRCKRPLF